MLFDIQLFSNRPIVRLNIICKLPDIKKLLRGEQLFVIQLVNPRPFLKSDI